MYGGGVHSLSNNIKTELSLPENINDIVSEVQKEIMEEELSEFSSIKKNDINIATSYVFNNGEYIEAKVYFRNGFFEKVNFERVQLFMVNCKNEVIGKKVFDLGKMGDILPGTARPWKLIFEKSEVDMDKFSDKGCKIVFDANLKVLNYATITLDESSVENKEYGVMFKEFINTLPQIEVGNISISKFKITLQKHGRIIITLIIRNACNQAISIEEIPLTIKDKKGNLILSTVFETRELKIESMKARVCNLAFDTKLNIEHSVMMDNWDVFFS